MVWVLLSVLFRSASSVAAKQASLDLVGSSFVAVWWNPWYLLSLALLVGQAGVWMLALRRLPLSFAYPFMSLSLLLDMLSGRLVFGEAVGPPQFLGASLILAGVALVGRGQAAADEASFDGVSAGVGPNSESTGG